MEVFRLASKRFPSLDGAGGLYSDGRWHSQGRPIVYTASSRSLSVLERFVHEQSIDVPSLVMMSIYIPDDIDYQHYTASTLPDEWDTIDNIFQSQTQALGDTFLEDNRYSYLKVPSAIVPHEYNYLINPSHKDSQRIRINESLPYHYDQRYKRFIKA